jgi:argininosuccinate lyase
MALWGGRFSGGPAASVAALSRSVQFDWRLAPYDLRVNRAHLQGLIAEGVVTPSDGEKIERALLELAQEIASGKFSYIDSDEDVHSAIERGLSAKLGELGGAIRAGRSRNDLVVTDFKLYLIDHLVEIAGLLVGLVEAINTQAMKHANSIAPGFTHLQHAQPIVFGHELAKHSHGLLRDVDRISDWLERHSFSPLGSGALAGSALQPNPEGSAQVLGFIGVMSNSIDATSDRDFVAEALFLCAMIGIHLSRLGEEFTLWSTSEFGWVTVADAYSTGSSIMPQKKNPDIAELARGKSGRLVGNLTSMLVTLKGLPFAYNRDLQEDKEPIFDSVETLTTLLPALIGMVDTAEFHPEVIESGVSDGYSLATEIADFLARKGVPFATAHEVAGKCVKACEVRKIELHELSDTEFAEIHPQLTPEVRLMLSAQGAVDSRRSTLATSPTSVKEQISVLQSENQLAHRWITGEAQRFTEMMNS